MTQAASDVSCDVLEARLRTLLPEEYRDRSDEVKPISMGSAGLKYGEDGRVAWNAIWATFCDLAMAGGPPHKGTLLEPASPTEIAAQPSRYRHVVDEICRGIALTTGLESEPSPTPGWIRVHCKSLAMAGWLVRAIAMENVSVRSCEGTTLDLPAGPDYRLEKEIKNVVTVLAKTGHYWGSHMPPAQRHAVARLLDEMDAASPLLQPGAPDDTRQASSTAAIAEAVLRRTGLQRSEHGYAGWFGVVCPNVRAAIWLMRLLVASNVLSRREGTTLFVPVNPIRDPQGQATVQTLQSLHGFATTRSIL